MFGYRWLEEVDQIQMSRWLAFDAMKGGGLATSQAFAEQFRASHLDRNIALVGRVIEGIEHMSSLPRGTGALGFCETEGEACRYCLCGWVMT